MLWSSYCPSRSSNVFENDVLSVKFVSGQFCIQSGWHQTEVVKLSWMSHFFLYMVNTGIIHILHYSTRIYLYEYDDMSVQRLSTFYNSNTETYWMLYFNVLYLRPWYVFNDLFILKCCAHHEEVKIAKGEVKQKSFITNEETFEGFFRM